MRTNESSTTGLQAYLAIGALINLGTWVLLLLPVYLQTLGWSLQKIGWAVGIFFFVNLVFQLVSGQLADRRGSIATALVGAGVSFGGGLLYLVAGHSSWMIFPARILHGAGAAMVTAGALVRLTQSVPQRLRGRYMGYFGLPGFVMIGLGPALSEWLEYWWGPQGSFVVVLVVYAVIAWLLSRLPADLPPGGNRNIPFWTGASASFPRLGSILAFLTCFAMCNSCWQSLLAPAVKGAGQGAVSGFGVGYAVGAVATRLGLSHRFDAGVRRMQAMYLLVPYGLGLFLIPYATSGWQLAAIAAVCGIGHGMFYPSLSSIATDRFHPEYPGQAMSLYISAYSLGMFIGPPVWGAIADAAGYKTAFAVSGAVLLTGVAAFVVSQTWKPWKQDIRITN